MDKNYTLYLVRHGETLLNYYNKMQGWADAPLTARGVQQAKSCGRMLQDLRFDMLFSSDLGRAMSTAQHIMRENKHDDAIPTAALFGLREVFFGALEGLNSDDVWDDMVAASGYNSLAEMEAKGLFHKPLDLFHAMDPAGDAENFAAFYQRLQPALDDIMTTAHPQANILVVGHGITLRYMIQALVPSFPLSGRFLGNASVTVLRGHSAGGFRMERFNQTEANHTIGLAL